MNKVTVSFNHCFYTRSEIKSGEISNSVKRLLGMRAKKKYFDPMYNTTVQEETTGPLKHTYHYWFNETQ